METPEETESSDAPYLKILRAMTPAQRLRTAHNLYETARDIKAAALRKQHPDWTEEQILTTVREVFLYART